MITKKFRVLLCFLWALINEEDKMRRFISFTILSVMVMGLCVIKAYPEMQTSPDGIWTALSGKNLEVYHQDKQGKEPWIHPNNFRVFMLDVSTLEEILANAPMERLDRVPSRRPSPASLTLPMPDGSYLSFKFVESPIMSPGLAAKFPGIKTYLGYCASDPTTTVRFDWTPDGFHAQVLGPGGVLYIDPYYKGETYVSYYKKDYRPKDKVFQCFVEDNYSQELRGDTVKASSGDRLYIYRLAVACTGEYAQYHGGTVQKAMSAITTTINRVNGIYEQEVAVRFSLVANNSSIIYTNAQTDPFDNDNPGVLINQSQSVIDSVIGDANYDIGHTVSTGGGGMGGLGVVCFTGYKAWGVTGTSTPIGDPYDVDYVCHEIGHQFSANHTFNGVGGLCTTGNASTAYEPGSGSTIMCYAGLCGADNLQSNGDPIFHSESYAEIRAYITTGWGSTCPVVIVLANNIPVANAGSDSVIPTNTPFTLTGSGTDADSDSLTYLWEERDLGPAAALSAADDGQIPLFRVWTPITSANRTFPRWSVLLSNTTEDAEKLPILGRTMNFRLTVRDNRSGGGGVDNDDMQVTVDGNSGPFRVTYPNQSTTFVGYSVITVTWNTAGTNTSPVNTSLVDIRISTDGGSTWSTLLKGNTPNDGSENVVLPNVNTSNARIKVESVGNIFFDISNQDFTITPSSTTPPIISLNRTQFYFASTTSGNATPSQTFDISNSGAGTLNWSVTDNAAWLNCSPLSGTNGDTVTVSVNSTGLSAGTYTGTINVSDPNATNSPQAVSVTLTVYNPGTTSVPRGRFSTPDSGVTVSSSIAVTGWALDDIGVTSLKIYSGQTYIGDAVFVEGQRPDIEAEFPNYPQNYRAGWGYMMLTNFLPGGGNGVYTLNAIATDVEGNQVTLGSKTITVDNVNVVKPFGAIDAPKQGGTASGSSFRNQGWVLTPQPNKVPEDGSTIKLSINGVPLNNPAVYNIYRPDIPRWFPGYANSNGAMAYFTFDTTAYNNGVHQIWWIATDDAGNKDGIGSRFFEIKNSGSGRSGSSAAAITQRNPIIGINIEEFNKLPDDDTPVRIKKGYREDIEAQKLYPDDKGLLNIKIRELERIVIQLSQEFSQMAGYLLVDNQLRSLPIGSTLNVETSTFYWQAGPGFVGDYHLVFVGRNRDGELSRRNILVKILPKFTLE